MGGGCGGGRTRSSRGGRAGRRRGGGRRAKAASESAGEEGGQARDRAGCRWTRLGFLISPIFGAARELPASPSLWPGPCAPRSYRSAECFAVETVTLEDCSTGSHRVSFPSSLSFTPMNGFPSISLGPISLPFNFFFGSLRMTAVPAGRLQSSAKCAAMLSFGGRLDRAITAPVATSRAAVVVAPTFSLSCSRAERIAQICQCPFAWTPGTGSRLVGPSGRIAPACGLWSCASRLFSGASQAPSITAGTRSFRRSTWL